MYFLCVISGLDICWWYTNGRIDGSFNTTPSSHRWVQSWCKYTCNISPVIYHLQFSSILIILHLIWLLVDWTLKLSENSNICNFCCCFVENLCVRLFAELSSVYPTPWPDQWSLSGKYLHLFFLPLRNDWSVIFSSEMWKLKKTFRSL